MPTITARPNEFSSVYWPLDYTIETDRFPNTRSQESGNVTTVRQVVSADLSTHPSFVVGETILETAALNTATHFKIGQHIYLDSNTEYNGVFRIKKVSGTTAFIIDAAYTVDGTGGTVAKYYNALRLKVSVFINGAEQTGTYETPITDSGYSIAVNGPLRNAVSGSIVEQDDNDITNTFHTVSENYYIKVVELFDEPDNNGLLISAKGTLLSDEATERVALQCVNQYVGFKGFTIDYYGGNLFTPFVVTPSTTDTRFLTNMPKAVSVGRNDAMQLGWLCSTDNFTLSYQCTVRGYDLAGTLLWTDSESFNPNLGRSFNRGVGPLNNISNMTAATVRLKVMLETSTQISEEITLNIDDTLYNNPIRFFWLNELGEYDSFTFVQEQTVSAKVSRSISQKHIGAAIAAPERELKTYGQVRTNTYTARTNLIDAETAYWLKELIASNDVFTTIEGQPGYLPINILTTTAPVVSNDGVQSQFEIEWAFAFNHRVPNE